MAAFTSSKSQRSCDNNLVCDNGGLRSVATKGVFFEQIVCSVFRILDSGASVVRSPDAMDLNLQIYVILQYAS